MKKLEKIAKVLERKLPDLTTLQVIDIAFEIVRVLDKDADKIEINNE